MKTTTNQTRKIGHPIGHPTPDRSPDRVTEGDSRVTEKIDAVTRQKPRLTCTNTHRVTKGDRYSPDLAHQDARLRTRRRGGTFAKNPRSVTRRPTPHEEDQNHD